MKMYLEHVTFHHPATYVGSASWDLLGRSFSAIPYDKVGLSQ